ncbi:MAG TPA: NrfD/PsrC family molybdoenzyme membrane anchor subunit [Gemmatimonadales bacterium]|nr:NrfD/PsrC family molybdoenzyme membrane anchor subunit [Gemmatimonadales bacterium]
MQTKTNLPSPTGYAGIVTKPPEWHTLVVFDILFNNLTTGLFLVAAVGELAAPATFTPVATWAYPVALALLLADFACLVLDLGDSLRFHHMLRVFKPSSPMSLGTWSLTVYSLLLTAIVAVEFVAAAGWVPGDSAAAWWIRTLAVVVGLPFAFGSAAYKGVLFSTTAQPGWKDARWLGAYLVNTAVTLGAAELLVIAALTGEQLAVDTLRLAVGLLIVLNLVALALLVGDLYPLLSRLYARREFGVAGLFVLLTGVVIPASSLLAGGVPVTASVAVASLILASLGVRFAIVRLPHDAT